MGLFRSQIRRLKRERVRKQAEQANIRRVIGADVSDDSISVHAPAMKSAGEVAVGAVKSAAELLARMAVFALCALGLIALMSPGTRRELLLILKQVSEQLRAYIGAG